MIRENKYCSDAMKEHFNEELVMTEEDNEILRTLLNVGFVITIILIMILK